MERNGNYFLAIMLSVLIVSAWQFLYVNPRIEAMKEAKKSFQKVDQDSKKNDIESHAQMSPAVFATSREQAIATSQRVDIDTSAIKGSINLKGARFDDIGLKEYHVGINKDSPIITLLNPSNDVNGYFSEIGYLSRTSPDLVPGPDSVWQLVSGKKLTPSTPITLVFKNSKGTTFKRIISIDKNYMFTIVDTITNNSAEPIKLSLYGRITRYEGKTENPVYVLHEGFIGVLDDMSLIEKKYTDIKKSNTIETHHILNGWLGITDKYWASILIPSKDINFESHFSFFSDGQPRYQADLKSPEITIESGKSEQIKNLLFAGAKEVPVIDQYEKEFFIPRFDRLIDWGWFYFITKPMFMMMDYLYRLVGNFGLAIMLTTIIVKLIFFPLANKQYASMANMKNIQPKIDELREIFKDDRLGLQKAVIELYKKENINPLAGCWPMILQIPVFFAIYKVIYITIEMRHAPFIGWIHDLSAPDPTNIINIFGLLPFEAPAIVHIGAWPLIMGLSMFLQMRMNPPPPDKTQAIIFNWMPVVFIFTLASFPAGLVIYWAWNNTLSIIQQAIIMKKHGVKVEIFKNISSLVQYLKKK